MKMTLLTNGFTFTSKVTDEVSVEEAKLSIYSVIEKMNKLEMECDDGSFVVIGEQALQNSILIFSEL